MKCENCKIKVEDLKEMRIDSLGNWIDVCEDCYESLKIEEDKK